MSKRARRRAKKARRRAKKAGRQHKGKRANRPTSITNGSANNNDLPGNEQVSPLSGQPDSEKSFFLSLFGQGSTLKVDAMETGVAVMCSDFAKMMFSHEEFATQMSFINDETSEFWEIVYKIPMKGVPPVHGYNALNAITSLRGRTFIVESDNDTRMPLDTQTADILRNVQCTIIEFKVQSFISPIRLNVLKGIPRRVRINGKLVAEEDYVWLLESYRCDVNIMPDWIEIEDADLGTVQCFLARLGTVNKEPFKFIPSHPSMFVVQWGKPRKPDRDYDRFTMLIGDKRYAFSIDISREDHSIKSHIPHTHLIVEFMRINLSDYNDID